MASLLIVTGGLLLAAGALFLAGRRRWAEMHKPEKTLQSVRENVEWLKHPTRS